MGTASAPPTLVGIDAGGTATRAWAVRGDVVVHRGLGGPGNPLATTAETLAASLTAALEGCPSPAVLVACVAGARGRAARERVERVLLARFPDAGVHVEPDYAAAFLAAPPGTSVVVVAGTGSIVCSRAATGEFVTSGGHGWIIGDHGSAARLGRAYLDWFCAQEECGEDARAAVERTFESADPRAIVAALQAAPAPAAGLAQGAPLLTAAAEGGEGWARHAVGAEMRALAATTASHVKRFVASAARGPVRVGLAGGVWSSAFARAAFEGELASRAPDAGVTVALNTEPPIEGAVRLARELAAMP